VHANYDKSGSMSPVAGVEWYEQPYGIANWDFDAEEDARAEFSRRTMERFRRGYELREGSLSGERMAISRDAG